MFEHKNIKIELSEQSGEFSARFDGRIVRAPSVVALKKKLDSLLEAKAGAFTALVNTTGYRSRGIFRVSIVGIEKARGRFGRAGLDNWKSDDGNTYHEVFTDTPENEAALKAAVELDASHAKEREALADKQQEASKAAWAALKRHEFPKG